MGARLPPVAPYAITPWYPPSGLSLALPLILGLQYAPALFIAALLAGLVVRGGGRSHGARQSDLHAENKLQASEMLLQAAQMVMQQP